MSETQAEYKSGSLEVERELKQIEIVPAGTMARLAAAEDLCWEIAYSMDTGSVDLKRIKKLLSAWMVVTKVTK